jgi:Superfamily I DNA and RNA helicases and helicase subunits
MPSLKKKALSLYFRNGCQRQLLLNLYNDKERKSKGMPERQQARAGLGLTAEMGYKWQDEKVNELGDVFGKKAVHVSPTKKGNRPASIPLRNVLPHLQPYQFIVEGHYDAATKIFKDAIGISSLQDIYGEQLEVSDALPDLIQVLPPAATPASWEMDQQDMGPVATMQAVQPNGDVIPLSSTDQRLRLRVIDIKLSAEPGAHYFAEVVFYSMTLAAWIQEYNWDQRFVVVAAPAVWPGSYDASQIRQVHYHCSKEGRIPDAEALAQALEQDIEVAPFDAFAPRLRRFFHEELPKVLQTSWNQLPWHVTHTCNSCEFLGYPWKDKVGQLNNSSLHCWPTAEATQHLSRIAGLSRGGAKLLSSKVTDVNVLASLLSNDAVFELSPSLRAKRSIYPYRAKALKKDLTATIPNSGGDALMPKWPDLHIYIFLDYDLSSAITATFALRAFWREPLPYDSTQTAKKKRWAARNGGQLTNFQEVYLVDQRNLSREREELIKFLRTLRSIITDIEAQDDEDIQNLRRGDINDPKKLKRSTYQIYLWDEAQRKQLTRVIGRHLEAILADKKIRDLAWLFPPPELLMHAEEASYKSPFTFVSAIVQNTVAVPIPHHYTLLDVAKTYHPASVNEISVHPLYREPLSDLIPGERLHEMWTRRGYYTETQRIIEETTARKLQALAYIVAQLEKDLEPLLVRAAAPPVSRNIKPLTGLPPRSILWYEFTRLNQALSELDEHMLRAMPAHEREARFKSAYLLKRLEGAEKFKAYQALQKTVNKPLIAPEELLIYQLNSDSYEFNVRPPALGYAISPKSDPTFLSKSAYPLLKGTGINIQGRLSGSVADAGLTKVSVVAIDRVNGWIALKPWHNNRVLEFERFGIADFQTDVILDPLSEDYLSKKVLLTLKGIGRPVSADEDESIVRALGITAPSRMKRALETPSSEFLWQAPALTTSAVTRDVHGARGSLESRGVQLNASQWEAWRAALTQRLTLIWGPPGTGKSQTLRAIISGAIWNAQQYKQPLRLLISSNNYTAIDNVLIGVDTLLSKVIKGKPYRLFRLQSQYNDPPADLVKHPDIEPVIVKTSQAPIEVQDLQAMLATPEDIIIVAGPPQQLHNLAIATKDDKKETHSQTQQRWFDLLIIDEASQLSVAEATLIISKAAENASFVLAGDDKQLPPIQPATPPENLEDVVGSVYNYIRHYHQIIPYPLQVNYRSSQTIVDFIKCAGYDPGLHAYHNNLRLTLLSSEIPTEKPANWPSELYWSSSWAQLLDPQYPATCFIYEDDIAGQSNSFEADAVASLIWLLYGRLDRQLSGERDGNTFATLTGQPHDEKSFWEQAIGVVTPHRAQMSKIVSRLQALFPNHNPTAIWNTVDTVERFQGQQRDIIFASFGLGDVDLIRSEDEFLYSLNRFNVMASRARAKLVVLLTRSLIDYLADDGKVLQESRLLKNFAESFCQSSTPIVLGYRENNKDVLKPGILRWR